MNPSITAVILAAGKGTRMKSTRAKVLHEVFFRPMLHHVLNAVQEASIPQCAIVVGHQQEAVLQAIESFPVTPVSQREQLGTGHAVLCAEEACSSADLVMILCGDTPLIQAATLRAMVEAHLEQEAALTLMTTRLDDPFGYGRILNDDSGRVLAIVEEKDASSQEREIQEINAGIYLVDRQFLFAALRQVGTNNSQGEVYLTDIVAIANRESLPVRRFIHPCSLDVLGVNSRIELAQAHATLQMRHNRSLMLAGVTMYAPESILVSPESQIGQDTELHAAARITGATRIGQRCSVAAGCVLHDCRIGDEVVIGANSVLQGCNLAAGTAIQPLTFRSQ